MRTVYRSARESFSPAIGEDDEMADLKKVQFYLNRYIELLEQKKRMIRMEG